MDFIFHIFNCCSKKKNINLIIKTTYEIFNMTSSNVAPTLQVEGVSECLTHIGRHMSNTSFYCRNLKILFWLWQMETTTWIQLWQLTNTSIRSFIAFLVVDRGIECWRHSSIVHHIVLEPFFFLHLNKIFKLHNDVTGIV